MVQKGPVTSPYDWVAFEFTAVVSGISRFDVIRACNFLVTKRISLPLRKCMTAALSIQFDAMIGNPDAPVKAK
jgi:hypothetical protein